MANYDRILQHALDNNLNVLFIGKHGCGKTSIVKNTFEKAGLNWRYFSASTMDPWVDFIGVPKSVTRKDGTQVLELIKPAEFADDKVEALFFDELNRSPKKIRNAIMELIQFKSINGKSFPNLKVVWAAINPDDDESEYDVEKMDEAQLDRFHFHIKVPYKPNTKFFKETYADLGERAVRWWNNQNKKVQDLVSPRRLEYAVQLFQAGGKTMLGSILPEQVNNTEFRNALSMDDPENILNKLAGKNREEIRQYFSNDNHYKHCRETLYSNSDFVQKIARHLHSEILLKEIAKSNKDTPRKLVDDMMSFPGEYEDVGSYVTKKSQNYADGLGMNFDRYEQNKRYAQQSNTYVSDGDLPEKIIVNGKEYETAKLNPSNFYFMTDKRFTLTTKQKEMVRSGQASRESFFPEFLKRINESVQQDTKNSGASSTDKLPF